MHGTYTPAMCQRMAEHREADIITPNLTGGVHSRQHPLQQRHDLRRCRKAGAKRSIAGPSRVVITGIEHAGAGGRTCASRGADRRPSPCKPPSLAGSAQARATCSPPSLIADAVNGVPLAESVAKGVALRGANACSAPSSLTFPHTDGLPIE